MIDDPADPIDDHTRTGNGLTTAIVISVGYVVVASLIFVLIAQRCAISKEHFYCLKPNETGDLIAGVCAPLAFIWLAVAVSIQSQELKAQRQELAATRQEYRLSRAALEAQVKESRTQAEYIGTQTAILQADHQERINQENDRVYEQRLTRFESRAVQLLSPFKVRFLYEADFVFDIQGEDSLRKLRLKVERINTAFFAQTLMEAPPEAVWRELDGMLELLQSFNGKLTRPEQYRFDEDRIIDLKEQVEMLAGAMRPETNGRRPDFVFSAV